MTLPIVTLGLLMALLLVLMTVWRVRPQRFKIRATLTKWASFDLEIDSPEPSASRPREQQIMSQHHGRQLKSSDGLPTLRTQRVGFGGRCTEEF